MLTCDLRYESSRTHYGAGKRISSDEVRAIFGDLERLATDRLRGWSGGAIAVERSAEMRYGEQIFEIDVGLDGLDWNDAALVDAIEDRFHRRHEELYTYASRDQEVVFVNARVAAVGEVAHAGEAAKSAQSTATSEPRSMRRAFFGEWIGVPVYAMETLKPGHSFAGPAIVEAETTTVVIGARDRLTVNGLGWLDIAVG
jgi:N-methylhydantoinase A